MEQFTGNHLQPIPNAAFDPFYAEIKHADVWPNWLKLQHEIRTQLERLMAESQRLLPADFGLRLIAINERIVAYNRHVPNIYLRKPNITSDNWHEQYEDWQ